MKLSQQRADAVRAYLVSHGLEPARLVSKGYGLTQPLVPNNTEGNRALNRRVQFIRTEAQAP
jgi:outer membrane protein OmpA-like peptidoglycan-associated protein